MMIENLSQTLRPVEETQNTDAAVALLLKPVNQDFKTLLVKRAEAPLDLWSGQMALPGGKYDPKDRDIRQTVIRETLEETAINIDDRCRFLGTLETMRSTIRPELTVTPFVILLEHEPIISLSQELVGYIWIFLRKLREYKGTAKLTVGEVSAYIVDGNVIWGLTYRILEKFTANLEWAVGAS